MPLRVLLDENLPRKLATLLTGHETATVASQRWAGVRNGELLRRAALEFDALMTLDRGIPHQNRLDSPLILVLLHARSNRLEVIEPLVPSILEALESAQPGTVVHVGPAN